MVVIGRLEFGDCEKMLFRGTKKECNDYVSTLDLNSFCEINIATDDGIIEESVRFEEFFFRVKDYVEKNPELEVRLDARESMDDCHSMFHSFWKGQARDIPEKWHDKFVISEGWMVKDQIISLSVYAPDMMTAQLEEAQAPQIHRHRGR